MFDLRIEQEAGAGFDGGAHAELAESVGGASKFLVEAVGEGIQQAVVEREADAAVADRVQQSIASNGVDVFKAVGDVAEEHAVRIKGGKSLDSILASRIEKPFPQICRRQVAWPACYNVIRDP